MRVISGEMKGRTLRVPADAAFRPTTDRVKESVFNILAGFVDWQDSTVCDLFAGSGSLGIEALSRGAARVCFVEESRASLAVLDRNISDLGLVKRTQVSRRNVDHFLRDARDRYTLVLADPPYRYQRIEELLAGIAGILPVGGIAMLEHEGERRVESTSLLHAFDRREYGTTAVTFFQPILGEPS
jgi:16S rRNA (guanine966-N2)-methyltransferase